VDYELKDDGFRSLPLIPVRANPITFRNGHPFNSKTPGTPHEGKTVIDGETCA
jgi:hypothetical protein